MKIIDGHTCHKGVYREAAGVVAYQYGAAIGWNVFHAYCLHAEIVIIKEAEYRFPVTEGVQIETELVLFPSIAFLELRAVLCQVDKGIY